MVLTRCSAQTSIGGAPEEFLRKKREELLKKREEEQKNVSAIQRTLKPADAGYGLVGAAKPEPCVPPLTASASKRACFCRYGVWDLRVTLTPFLCHLSLGMRTFRSSLTCSPDPKRRRSPAQSGSATLGTTATSGATTATATTVGLTEIGATGAATQAGTGTAAAGPHRTAATMTTGAHSIRI